MNPKLIPLIAVTGCVATTQSLVVPALSDDHVSYSEWNQLDQEVRADIERLNALDIMTVSELVVDAPAASGNCYGPCEEDPVDQRWLQEFAQQAARLGALADYGDAVAPSAEEGDLQTIQASLDALNELRIVEVTMHEGSANCYNLPCPEDIPEMSAKLSALAAATAGL